MSGYNSTVFDSEKLQSNINKYFEKRLDALGLSMNSLRRQSEESLRRSLTVVNHAIENHESFGKFQFRVSADTSIMLGKNKSEATTEFGILPLLLERYQLIIKRLEEFDKRNKMAMDNLETSKTKMRAELEKIARAEINRRLWIFISILVILWAVLFFLISRFGWDAMEPWTYLLGIGLAIGSYGYFALRQREFAPLALYQHALESRKKELFEIFGFDEQ